VTARTGARFIKHSRPLNNPLAHAGASGMDRACRRARMAHPTPPARQLDPIGFEFLVDLAGGGCA